MVGVREACMPRPRRPTSTAGPPAPSLVRPCRRIALSRASAGSTACTRLPPPRCRDVRDTCLCGARPGKWPRRTFKMYELVSFVKPLYRGQVAMHNPPKQKRQEKATRQQDPEGTRRNILEVASEEFARNG